jgi:Protein of unknown function (DUF3309)
LHHESELAPKPFHQQLYTIRLIVGQRQPESNGAVAGTYPVARRKTMVTVLLIVVLLMAIGAFPAWPYSSGWGYYPSGGLGLVLVVLVILLVLGRL